MSRAFDPDRRVKVYGYGGGVRPDLDDELLSPFNAQATRVPRRVRETHDERSARAKTMDDAQQAPVTTDPEVWLSAPNRYDYLGVDTLDLGVRRDRADALVEAAPFDDDVVDVEADLPAGTRGRARYRRSGFATPAKVNSIEVDRRVTEGRVSDPRFQYPEVLSHEVGHAFDALAADKERRMASSYELRGERREQAKRLSTMMRGPFDDGDGYRDTAAELTADAAAFATVAPRAARREAPDLVDWMADRLGLPFR